MASYESCRCYIVPPHLLRGIAESSHNSDKIRSAARASIAAREKLVNIRKERLAALTQPRGYRADANINFSHRHIIPDAILRHLSESEHVDEETRLRAKHDLGHLEQVIERVRNTQQGLTDEQHVLAVGEEAKKDHPKDKPYRAVYTMKNSEDQGKLPGKMVRAEGEPKVEDKAANDAFDNVGAVLAFYKEHFKWNSIDNKNHDVISSIHFGKAYENAFWDPETFQMVFGDGDEFLNNFTGCIDVIGHELTHAVTEHTAPLDYYGQPGALNEHVSDVFGIMCKQKLQDEDVEHADWLIGEDCILPGVKGTALRNMMKPGTAYDDPRFGKDPQVGSMKQFKTTFEDNGGVHIYSGIPNRAFYLAAKAFGGYSWEKAGQIWWKTMQSRKIPAQCSFKQFADVTVDIAEEAFDKKAAEVVRKAWAEVGILIGASGGGGGGGPDKKGPGDDGSGDGSSSGDGSG